MSLANVHEALSKVTLCSKCSLALTGQFVRALGGAYHLSCFTCVDCKKGVAKQFYPIQIDETTLPLCEQDYFRRLNLVCAKCDGIIRGSYINALGRKYHVHHFCCSFDGCDVLFGPKDSYYEHRNQVYCNYHYSLLFASKCSGCGRAILKQFVESNRTGKEEHWHPECYMIQKSWNVRLMVQNTVEPAKVLSKDRLLEDQKRIEHVVFTIWSTLSSFEESSASCISDMLLHVSNGNYLESCLEADYFISHVQILFNAIDFVEEGLDKVQLKTGLKNEPKLLAKKVVSFFSLLSSISKNEVKHSSVTQELLALVTSLAQHLKTLIRVGLSSAIVLEEKSGLGLVSFIENMASVEARETKRILNPEVKTDLCFGCRQSIEEKCYKYKSARWHVYCFICCKCKAPLKEALISNNTFYCKNCDVGECIQIEAECVSQLSQYAFLLRVALKRLYNMIVTLEMDEFKIEEDRVPKRLKQIQHREPRPRSARRMKDQSKIAHRTTLVEDDSLSPEMVDPAIKAEDLPLKKLVIKDDAINRSDVYLSELTPLELFTVKHLAVTHMSPLFERQFDVNELLDLVEERKPSFWNRFKSSIKKKEGLFGVPLDVCVEKDGVESYLGAGPQGVVIPAFVHNAVEELYKCKLKFMIALSTEGLFRLSGNVRRRKELVELLDSNANSTEFIKEGPVMIAALIKQYLRELPEPLITPKLHSLFLATQALKEPDHIKSALHYLFCLLPAINRDLIQVILSLLRSVAKSPESKMDYENLSRVMAPNLMRANDHQESLSAASIVYCLLEAGEGFECAPKEIVKELEEKNRLKSCE